MELIATDRRSLWRDLSKDERAQIMAAMQTRRVARGEVLISEGSEAHALFIVQFGLFEVTSATFEQSFAEIGAGELIGEIGFFAGAPRNASVVAQRDSQVLEIDRAQFDALTARVPSIQRAVTKALAKRLASVTLTARKLERRPALSRVVALVAAGAGTLPADFLETLRRTLALRCRSCFLTAADAAQFGTEAFDRYAVAAWLAQCERDHDLVVVVADASVSEWTHEALHAADQVLLVAVGEAAPLNPVEALALELFPKARRRLVRVHSRRAGFAAPGAAWLRQRDVFMIHNVAMQDDADFQSLGRFLSKQAVGFVAGGGGAFGPAHVGLFKAFREKGVTFDIYGGSSIGAAMAAGIAMLMEPDAIKEATHDLFVRRRAMKRLTLPYYGLIDHTFVEAGLRRIYGEGAIEDMWKPFFAVAADLSTYEAKVIREGPLWQGVRASCAIPGVLPPFFDASGHMLVDGGVVDNVPVGIMDSLKFGPNLVINLHPSDNQLYDFDHSAIPGRSELLWHMLNFLPKRRKLPEAPGPASVIQRSIFSNIRESSTSTGAHSLVLSPPAFSGSSFMDWRSHAQVLEDAYGWGLKVIDELRAAGSPAMAAMDRCSGVGAG